MTRTLQVIAFLLLLAPDSYAQFTLQDTLRGSITPERAWWDLTYYHLDIAVDMAERTIAGSNTVQYRVLEPGTRMQIDLQPPMQIDAVEQDGDDLEFERLGNVYYITLRADQKPGAVNNILITYSGQPREAVNAPWDGGFSWKVDDNGNPFVATSDQGIGASLWWPNKDHMYDEPDSMLISVRVPDSLMDVSNGRLRSVEGHDDGTRTFHWFVDNPISNYGVNVNIADYVHWSETYEGEKGTLDLSFYVLPYNLPRAERQFKQTHMMLRAFEYWFGPYPFYEDGFKLVEVPYLGMEHQSSVTYGNGFGNGYLGRDLSGSGWGLEWDYIIIHESGHEWFANNITYRDIADMWVHESFTTYAENLFIDYHYGTKAATEYVIGQRRSVRNASPIIGRYDVNQEGSGDMYPKGANMLHTIRTMVDDDEKWRSVLRGLNEEFYHQTVTTQQIEQYMIDHTGLDLQPVFDQYLRDFRIPALEYRWEGGRFNYRWTNAIDRFNMPVEVNIAGRVYFLHPTSSWQEKAIETNGESDEIGEVTLNPNYYVTITGV
ncbi:MAG: M1 family metallopeptidase [Pirellulaceae bacterium]